MNGLNKLIPKNYRGLALLLTLWVSLGQAQDVVLVPGYIEGTVEIHGVETTWIYVQAYAGSENAYTSTSASNYKLTVNVPEGGNLDYSVSAQAYSGNNNYLYFSSQTVNVVAGATSPLNFYVNPGTINGQITLNGATLNYGYVYAYSSSGSQPTNAQGYFSSNGAFSFPAQPNTDIRLSGEVYDTAGNRYQLPEATGLTLTTDVPITQNWTLEAGTASISGPISLNINNADPVTVNYQNVYGYAYDDTYGSRSASDYRYDNFGDYALTALYPGNYRIEANLNFNGYDDYFTFPYSVSNTANDGYYYNHYIPVATGEAVTHPIVADAKFINGYVSLSGSKGINDLNSGHIELRGANNVASYGGRAQDYLDTNTGAFDLIASAGQWIVSNIYLNFYDSDPDNYLNSSIYIYDYARQQNPFDLSTQNSINNVQLNYVTGTVTVNYSITGGGKLSSPYLQAYCNKTENNQTLMSLSGWAYGPYEETELGSATLVGLPMTCSLTAYANVGGSQTTFGQLEVEILPGTDIVVDIGGPTLTVSQPAPESYTTEALIEVSGTATDDQGVASVTVNGNPVTLTSMNNPADPNEVQFSTTLGLSSGPNAIQTVAIDQAGKQASDTRKVYLDASAPTLTWTPADGMETTQSSVTVQGTATDDVAISEIKVNGSSISFASTGSSDPNEVAFSTTVNLVDGDNAILVSAKDSSNRTTSQTHTVKKVAAPMMCDVDGDRDVDRNDVLLIIAARNTPAIPGDTRDADGDGVITVLDARKCTLLIPR